MKKGRFWWFLEDFEGFTRILKLFDRFQSLFPSIWGRWSLENPLRTHPEPVLESISLDLEGFSSFCPGYEYLFPSRICAKSLFWTLKMDKMTVSEAWKMDKMTDFEAQKRWFRGQKLLIWTLRYPSARCLEPFQTLFWTLDLTLWYEPQNDDFPGLRGRFACSEALRCVQMCSNRLFCCFKCFFLLFLCFSMDLRRIPIEIHPFPSQIDPTYSRYFLKYLIMGIHTHTQGPTHTHRTYRGAAGDRTGGAGGGTCYLEKTDPTFFGALWLTPRCLETRFWPFLETHFDDFASIESILSGFEWFYAVFVLFLLFLVPLG